MGNPDGQRALGRPMSRWENNIKVDLKEIQWESGLVGSGLGQAQVMDSPECGNKTSGSTKCGKFPDWLRYY